MPELYKCPHCKKGLHPLRLPKFKGGHSRTYEEWSGIWYCLDCHALVLVAHEMHAAPVYFAASTDWLKA